MPLCEPGSTTLVRLLLLFLTHAQTCSRLVNDRGRSRQVLERAVALGHNFVVYENITVIYAPQNMLLGAIEGVAHEELPVGGPTDDFDFEERNS